MKAVLHPVNQPLTPGLDAASDLLKKYEASCKLRINVLGALHYGAISSRLIWESRTSNWDSLSFLKFIWHRVAGLDTALGEVPVDWKVKSRRVVVLDNYRVDQSRLVELSSCAKEGRSSIFLPAALQSRVKPDRSGVASDQISGVTLPQFCAVISTP